MAYAPYIHRHLEQVLPNVLETFPSVIVTGPRQVGKTTLLKQALPEGYRYVTLDDLVVRAMAQNDPALFMLNNPGKVIIDEVQYASDLFPYLKIQIDEDGEDGKYVLSGSQKYSLMEKASESLAGRIAILELQGFSLRELMEKEFYEPFLPTNEYVQMRRVFEESRSKLLSDVSADEGPGLWRTIQHGLLPRMQRLSVDWEQYYSAYVQTYIERDVRKLAQIGNELQFQQFMIAMAARTGELLNYSALSRDVGISVDTVKRWTSILRASGIIMLLRPYANNALTRVVKTPKVFFMDTGLACYLSGWNTPEVLQRGAKAGAMFETFVVSEIAKSWMYAGKSLERLYYYRDKQDREIDLVIVENGVLTPIEIKMTARPELSMARAFECLDKVPGMKRGLGVLVCQRVEPTYLSAEVVSLPVSYL